MCLASFSTERQQSSRSRHRSALQSSFPNLLRLPDISMLSSSLVPKHLVELVKLALREADLPVA